MIMKRIKCPKCGKQLLQGYSYAVTGIGCSCGGYVELKNGKVPNDTDEAGSYKKNRKKGHDDDDYAM